MGILLLAMAPIWILFVCWLSDVFTKWLPTQWRIPVFIFLLAAFIPLPLIDEIVGGWQFKELCAANSQIQIDRAAAAGKTVYLSQTADAEINGTWVRVVLKPWRFVDVVTGETIVSYNTLTADGGLLYGGFTEGGVPMTFAGHCSPINAPASIQTFKPFGIDLIEPPKRTGATK